MVDHNHDDRYLNWAGWITSATAVLIIVVTLLITMFFWEAKSIEKRLQAIEHVQSAK